MASISAASRSAFRRTIARTSVPASRPTLRCFTSTVSDNDPQILELEKQRNLSEQQRKTSTPIPEGAPGWNEALATSSEAAVKADHDLPSGKPLELQERTASDINRRHRSEENPDPYEPDVGTAAMQNSEESTHASYSRDEVSGPLRTAHGTVVEEVEYREDVTRRKAAAA